MCTGSGSSEVELYQELSQWDRELGLSLIPQTSDRLNWSEWNNRGCFTGKSRVSWPRPCRCNSPRYGGEGSNMASSNPLTTLAPWFFALSHPYLYRSVLNYYYIQLYSPYGSTKSNNTVASTKTNYYACINNSLQFCNVLTSLNKQSILHKCVWILKLL